MSSLDRSILNRRGLLSGLALLPLAALAACGFTPAYAPGSLSGSVLGTVWAANPQDKDDFDFVERIEERLGRPETRLYDLGYDISTRTIGAGVTITSTTTRYNIEGTVTYRLVRVADGKVMASGTAKSFTGYAATGSTVAGLAAEEDAALRLMRILADQVVTRVVAELARATATPAASTAAASSG